jgi:hypothetical protein
VLNDQRLLSLPPFSSPAVSSAAAPLHHPVTSALTHLGRFFVLVFSGRPAAGRHTTLRLRRTLLRGRDLTGPPLSAPRCAGHGAGDNLSPPGGYGGDVTPGHVPDAGEGGDVAAATRPARFLLARALGLRFATQLLNALSANQQRRSGHGARPVAWIQGLCLRMVSTAQAPYLLGGDRLVAAWVHPHGVLLMEFDRTRPGLGLNLCDEARCHRRPDSVSTTRAGPGTAHWRPAAATSQRYPPAGAPPQLGS